MIVSYTDLSTSAPSKKTNATAAARMLFEHWKVNAEALSVVITDNDRLYVAKSVSVIKSKLVVKNITNNEYRSQLKD